MQRPGTQRHDRDPEAGGVLVFWAVSIVALLGMVALSFDLGRVSSTHSELQSFADNIAIAAAAELDGKPDAITRAQAAALTLITDEQTFLERGRDALTAADYTLSFYRSNGTAPTSNENIVFPEEATQTRPATVALIQGSDPADQRAAEYVRAVVAPDSAVLTPFAAVLGLVTGSTRDRMSVSAQAVANLDIYACDITPLMFCVPSGWRSENNLGQMIRLRTGANNNTPWGPGDFGFLDPSKREVNPGGPCRNLTGAKLDACLIAAEGAVAGCFRQEGVDIEPGQKTGRNASAFNILFDIYASTVSNLKNDGAYPPAPNVIKGIKAKSKGKGSECVGNQYEISQAVSLPRDGCLNTGTCTPQSRFGTGSWDRAAYLAANHASDPTAAHPLPGGLAGTRYEMYRAEILSAGANPTRLTRPGLDESGLPGCAPAASADINRRVLIAAAIDCQTNQIGGAATNVPVEEFVKIFLTEPVGYASGAFDDSDKFDIHVEIVGSAETVDEVAGAKVRKVVRLQR